ncbi:MAG: hypothetical protein F4246_03495 [Rhodothermaceae bacterium]|nr:hypothetical protein [Rhodothermaceae bacterium]MXX57645.1 hypothetical protein [Rhodothermaceae bacterium]MYD56062.1 hypothetical protein [Rhodothermaceae bacterium]MYI44075.1 hypothetical protein [Rhodothermaceae bacterium]MYJ57055.1 hypothetical protein [Rhodothermaceae bacterium]
MTDLPFDKFKVAPELKTALNSTRDTILESATLEARRVWGITGASWTNTAFESGPEWAYEQLTRCREAVEITNEVMQKHMVSRFQGPPPALGIEWETWDRERRQALSEAQNLCRDCIREINRLEGKEIDKSSILERFQSRSQRRRATGGGFER